MLDKGDGSIHYREQNSLDDGLCDLAEDDLAEIVLLQEVQEPRLENKKIRVAGIVKFVDLVEQEITLFHEFRSLRVSLRKLKKSTIQGLERGNKVEVIGYLMNQENFNTHQVEGSSKNERNLILIAQVLKNIEETNLHFHQLSIILRRKILNSANIIC
ncbi:uncharacterized protein cubi_03274 [Cryptosporidium ubiquitum]|uniref:Uncharacterized protein n=1 Tax=Cryptosporidium ubiquitum TaxID=857276 RepID=A0A1J4M9S7_9CRYT|nr:uncharacterized protein cubi_03274 [Cryptosporidium ubiquitum]OII70976.1 hypothetical protein cubi_03274 [Cryptosporidium ubiquitum]